MFGFLLVFVVSCATTDFVTGSRTRNMYALAEDVKFGEEVQHESIEEMRKQGVPINRDTKRVKQLQDMVQRITAISHIPDLPYEVNLFETNIVNAMAAPGGKIIVFSGLYDEKVGIAKTDDEIAAVISHEIAHVTCRHTTENLTRQALPNLLLVAAGLYAEIEGSSDIRNAVAATFLLYNGLWLPKYSRTDEAEADRVGLMYLAKAGYDPRAAPRLWKRVHEKQGSGNALTALISTHPTNKDRWQNLEKHLPAAMEEYKAATGSYPSGYVPGQPISL